MSPTEISKLIAGIHDLKKALIMAEIKATALVREVEALRDIQRAAQYLVDTIHVHGNTTNGGPFIASYDNLREALKHYYAPNGPSTPQPH